MCMTQTGYIGHEAMRHHQVGGTVGPYATGDAIAGGWGLTNLALYGSSHVGILGGIIDTTNVPGVCRLDLLKTDYFHDSAYASYLYYNPDSALHSIQIDVGSGLHDLYDLVTKAFLKTNIGGLSSIELPGKEAVVLVVAPAGGTVTYQGSKMLINGVVVDYHSFNVPGNNPPRIKGLGALPDVVYPAHTSRLFCAAVDPDGDSLTYAWSAPAGVIAGTGKEVTWNAPASTGAFVIGCTVTDGQGNRDSARVRIGVVDSTGPDPVIHRISARPGKVDLNATSMLLCSAYDPSGYPLTYSWASTHGNVAGADSTASWTAPSTPGNYFVRCTVSNGHGGQAVDSLQLEVRDFRVTQHGHIVAYYPFNGNANDASGFNNNGTVNGAVPASDRMGNPSQAYLFNGSSSWIQVPNSASLNFDSSITVAFWMNIKAAYPTREQYPISHGNWQNRWKFSISNPSNKVRWTVRTMTSTKDLDSRTLLSLNRDYHVVGVYNGSDFELYLNGELEAFTALSGLISHTTYDLSIGRSLPSEGAYSFNGVLDEVRIYDYALSYQEIQELYRSTTGVQEEQGPSVPKETVLYENYPNPFNPSTTVKYSVGVASGGWQVASYEGGGSGGGGRGSSNVKVAVYDLLGREVAVLVNERKPPGSYEVSFDGSRLASGMYIYRMTAGSFVQTRTMVLLK